MVMGSCEHGFFLFERECGEKKLCGEMSENFGISGIIYFLKKILWNQNIQKHQLVATCMVAPGYSGEALIKPI